MVQLRTIEDANPPGFAVDCESTIGIVGQPERERLFKRIRVFMRYNKTNAGVIGGVFSDVQIANDSARDEARDVSMTNT